MPKGVPKPEYTGEFKQMVVETMRKEKLSQYQVSSDKGTVLLTHGYAIKTPKNGVFLCYGVFSRAMISRMRAFCRSESIGASIR